MSFSKEIELVKFLRTFRKCGSCGRISAIVRFWCEYMRIMSLNAYMRPFKIPHFRDIKRTTGRATNNWNPVPGVFRRQSPGRTGWSISYLLLIDIGTHKLGSKRPAWINPPGACRGDGFWRRNYICPFTAPGVTPDLTAPPYHIPINTYIIPYNPLFPERPK